MKLYLIYNQLINTYGFLKILVVTAIVMSLSNPVKADPLSCLERCVLSSQCGSTEIAQTGRIWCKRNCGMTGCGIIANSVDKAGSSISKAFSKGECKLKCSSKTICNKSKSIALKCKNDCPTSACGKSTETTSGQSENQGKNDINQISDDKKEELVLGAKILESMTSMACQIRHKIIELGNFSDKEKNLILGSCTKSPTTPDKETNENVHKPNHMIPPDYPPPPFPGSEKKGDVDKNMAPPPPDYPPPTLPGSEKKEMGTMDMDKEMTFKEKQALLQKNLEGSKK